MTHTIIDMLTQDNAGLIMNFMNDYKQWGIELTMAAIALNLAATEKRSFTLIDFSNQTGRIVYRMAVNQ